MINSAVKFNLGHQKIKNGFIWGSRVLINPFRDKGW